MGAIHRVALHLRAVAAGADRPVVLHPPVGAAPASHRVALHLRAAAVGPDRAAAARVDRQVAASRAAHPAAVDRADPAEDR